MEKIRALGDLVQEIFREMKEKSEFYQESVKGYLLAFLMEAARLNAEDSLLPGEELPVVGKQIWKEGDHPGGSGAPLCGGTLCRTASGGGSGGGLRPQRDAFSQIFLEKHAADSHGICQ